MPHTIRPATPADAPLVVEFNRLLAEETEGKTLDRAVLTPGVQAGLADPHKALYFVAEVDGVVAGQIMVTREWSDWRNGWLWWVQSVYVRRELRRRGVFRDLFAHVERLARSDSSVIGIRLYVEHANHSAQQTYRQLGMEEAGYAVWEKLWERA
jgi:GNAT superfamily N-acetyltransferase